MKNIFAIMIICSFFYACKPGVPSDVIQPDKMEKVLFDIHIVDGYIGTQPKPDTVKIIASSYYKGIYKKFAIDSATYNRSLNYYYNHPDVLTKMYEYVMKELEKTRKTNDKRIETEARDEQHKYLAKHARVLDVSNIGVGRPKFNFTVNPFTYTVPLAN
jgi:hypothetical protein